MSAQLELICAYGKALGARDYDALRAALHPTHFTFDMYPRSMGVPKIPSATMLVSGVQAHLNEAQEVHFDVIEQEVLEQPGRIWVAVSAR
jgi:hypothetical protein